jgi:y4mF family transcriptional regulator
MQFPITSTDDLGLAIRAVRKATHVRQDDLAGTLGFSTRFASEVEHGKPTAQLGKVLQLLHALGITLTLDLPDDAEPVLHELQQRFEAQAGRHQRRGPRSAEAGQAE